MTEYRAEQKRGQGTIRPSNQASIQNESFIGWWGIEGPLCFWGKMEAGPPDPANHLQPLLFSFSLSQQAYPCGHCFGVFVLVCVFFYGLQVGEVILGGTWKQLVRSSSAGCHGNRLLSLGSCCQGYCQKGKMKKKDGVCGGSSVTSPGSSLVPSSRISSCLLPPPVFSSPSPGPPQPPCSRHLPGRVGGSRKCW